MNNSIWGNNHEIVEQDLISKLEKDPIDNQISKVDCTLKLGLTNYQPPSTSIAYDNTSQATPPIQNYGNVDASQVPNSGGMMNGTTDAQFYASTEMANCNVTTSTFTPSRGLSDLVIYNKYENVCFMNPQTNITESNDFQKSDKTKVVSLKKCMVCDTSETPMWRKGPNGEKSLCNACGIRYRTGERKKIQHTLPKKSGRS